MPRASASLVWRIAKALPAFISITPCAMAITRNVGTLATRRWPRDRKAILVELRKLSFGSMLVVATVCRYYVTLFTCSNLNIFIPSQSCARCPFVPHRAERTKSRQTPQLLIEMPSELLMRSVFNVWLFSPVGFMSIEPGCSIPCQPSARTSFGDSPNSRLNIRL